MGTRVAGAKGRSEDGYGRGVVEIGTHEYVSGEDVAGQLKTLFGSPDYEPPVLPAIALEVEKLVRKPDAGIPDVVKLVERDALLAADVLRRAQSPAYATKVPPRSLADAASRLGLSGIRDVVWAVSMKGTVFRAAGYDDAMECAKRHSFAVATATRHVASYTSVAMDYGFLLGLLHDIGLIASMVALAAMKPRPKLADVAIELDALNEEAGATVARLWELPEELQWCIGSHRNPNLNGYDHPLIACECIAHRICERHGYGMELADDKEFGAVGDVAHLRSARALDLSEAMLEKLAQDVLPLLADA